jgi:FKBP-type peptidyl-prolyl cis-trans isomerase
VQVYMQKAMEKKAAQAKVDNAKFLEDNKKVEGVQTTKSGLQYKVISSGKGKAPLATDKVTVHYTGKLIDGTTFDSSVGRDPITFEVGGVIPGWTEALQLMHEGDKWMIYLPYDIAYGERGAGDQIPPYATLIFEVELIKVN